jgi:acetyltransferase-like isoleucine patch superfamily enzyme
MSTDNDYMIAPDPTIGSWLLAPVRLVKLLIAEIQGVLAFLIIVWPSTPLGYLARRKYWRRKTGASDILMARGARITGSEFIRFGEHLAIGENVEFVADGTDGLRVFIGSNILFARGVYLRSSNHALEDRHRRILDQGHVSKRILYEGSEYAIVIEDDCWIGANVIILSGAFIGKGAVIGAGSVVLGTIPPYTIAGGIPAKVIAERQ